MKNRGRRADGGERASCNSCTSSHWSAPDAETLSSSPAPVLPGFRPSRREQTSSTPIHSVVLLSTVQRRSTEKKYEHLYYTTQAERQTHYNTHKTVKEMWEKIKPWLP